MAAPRNDITAERVRELLEFNPFTGIATNRTTRSPNALKGAVAGSIHSNGYRIICIDGRDYMAHRLAWLYFFGVWPTQIDHINGVRDDNRMSNLRSCTQAENAQNVVAHRDSLSGLIGAHFHKQSGRWSSKIRANERIHYLGCFPTAELAHQRYLQAKAELHTFCQVPRHLTPGV